MTLASRCGALNIDSFSTGPHVFEDDAEQRLFHGERMPISLDTSLKPFRSMLTQMLGNLRQLYRPVTLEKTGQLAEGNFKKVAAPLRDVLSSLPKLTHLSLILRFRVDRVEREETWSWRNMYKPFMYFLEELELPPLYLLDLRGWLLPGTGFQHLLEGQRASLRELRLLNCMIDGSTHDLALWDGENIELTGVELDAAPPYRGRTNSIESV